MLKPKSRKFLTLEPLEDRCCPSAVFSYDGTNLTLTGDNLGDTITAKVTATNTVNIKFKSGAGPTINYGTYTVGGTLTLNGGNGADTILLDLNGHIFGGNAKLNAGLGNNTVNVDSVAAADGQLQGNLSITSGSGADSVTIGATNAVSLGGVNDTINTGGGGDTVHVSHASILSGNVTFLNANTITFGDGTNVAQAGNLTIKNAALGGQASSFTLAANSVVNHSFAFTGGNGMDTVDIEGALDGSAQITTGNSTNSLTIGPAATVNSGLTYTGGSGADTVSIDAGAVISGNLTLNLGDGNNTGNFNTAFTVNGSMTVNGGSGDDNMGTFSGTVNGDLAFNLGTGNNTVDYEGSAVVNLNYSGNANDTFTFGTSISGNLNVNGVTTFTFNALSSVGGNATIDFGTDADADLYTNNGVTVGGTLTILNYP
jgi:hypothetical protein